MNFLTKKNIKVTYKLLISMFFAVWFANIPHEIFLDRANYLNYLIFSDSVIDNRYGNGIVYFFLNEPAWLYLNVFLSKLSTVFSFESLLRIYPFFITFVVSYYLLSANSKFFLSFCIVVVFLFVLPQGVGYTLGGLRQSIATTFLLVYLLSSKKTSHVKIILLLAFLSLIHSLFFIFTVIYLVIFSSKKNRILSERMTVGVYIVAAALLVVFLVKYSGLGSYARQGTSIGTEIDHSGFLFFVYLMISILYIRNYPAMRLSESSIVVNSANLSLVFLASYLIMYWIMPGTGRVLNTLMPFLLFATLNRLNTYSISILSLIFVVVLLTVGTTKRVNSTYVNYNEYYQYMFFQKTNSRY